MLLLQQKKDLGANDNNDEVDGPRAIETIGGNPSTLALPNQGQMIHAIVARPDGLVREVKEKKVVSREEIDERIETEDIQILGDFSDEVSHYIELYASLLLCSNCSILFINFIMFITIF